MENREIEAALVLVASRPQSLLERLESLEQLAGCTLRPSPAMTLHDVYYDRPSRPLRARGYSLRLRRADCLWLLALKGRSRRSDLATDRLEIEGPPADSTVANAIERELGPTFQLSRDREALWRDPTAALAAAGWVPIQSRETLRRPRDLVAPGDDIPGQMAIDTVSYAVAGRTLRHHEVEIEITGAGDLEFLQRAARELLQRFAPEIEPWPHSKLATGVAIEALAATEGTTSLTDVAGEITPYGHSRIHAYLKEDRP